MDFLSQEDRSRLMAKIKCKDTTPELKVRSFLHRLGYRYRLHSKKLPGKPDLVLPKYQTVIFVHGCFWHQHNDCRAGHMPKSNSDYWRAKLNKNVERDKKHIVALEELGWKVVVVWECETKDDAIFFNAIKRIEQKLRQ